MEGTPSLTFIWGDVHAMGVLVVTMDRSGIAQTSRGAVYNFLGVFFWTWPATKNFLDLWWSGNLETPPFEDPDLMTRGGGSLVDTLYSPFHKSIFLFFWGRLDLITPGRKRFLDKDLS